MKKGNSFPIILIIMALISFMCLSLSASYAYVTRVKMSSNTQVISTGNFTSTIEYNAKNNIAFTTLTDEEGLSSSEYGIISISKDNNYTIFYNLNIFYELSSLEEEDYDKLVPMEYIKVALFEVENGKLSNDPVVGPVNIIDLPITYASSESVYNDTYLLAFGRLLAGKDQKTYAIKAWIDDTIDETYDDTLVYLGIKVTQEALISKSIYTLKGVLYDENGNILPNTKLTIGNGLISTYSDENGNYALENVVEGTYNLTVETTNEKYNTTVHLQNNSVEGSTIGIKKHNTSWERESFIQSVAYANYTTVGMVLKLNEITGNTNSIQNIRYDVPSSYIITGEDVLGVVDIDNISVNLLNDKTLKLEA